MVRAFIAIPINEATRGELVSVQSELPRTAGKMKLVEPQNLHLTLKFLGEVEEEKIPEIHSAVSRTLEGMEAFTMRVAGIGAFPSPRNIRVIWAGVREGEAQVRAVQRRIDAALVALGFSPERNFYPHVTIARVKFVHNRSELASFIDLNRNREFGEVQVTRIELMRSTLTPQGPIYSKLAEVELKSTL